MNETEQNEKSGMKRDPQEQQQRPEDLESQAAQKGAQQIPASQKNVERKQ